MNDRKLCFSFRVDGRPYSRNFAKPRDFSKLPPMLRLVIGIGQYSKMGYNTTDSEQQLAYLQRIMNKGISSKDQEMSEEEMTELIEQAQAKKCVVADENSGVLELVSENASKLLFAKKQKG